MNPKRHRLSFATDFIHHLAELNQTLGYLRAAATMSPAVPLPSEIRFQGHSVYDRHLSSILGKQPSRVLRLIPRCLVTLARDPRYLRPAADTAPKTPRRHT